MESYVRFDTAYGCEMSSQRLGVFRAAGEVEERAELPEWTRTWLRERLDWFNANLPAPGQKNIDRRAIFWFDATSSVVREIWSLAAALQEEGVAVSIRRTSRPGQIVYRDQFQVAAIPWRK